jgi:2-haloacid dehalogenase
MTPIRALIFDVFGTLVDWHGSVAREVAAVLGPRVPDPQRFAVEWRGQYQPSMQAVRSGALPFSKLDVLHRHNLDRVLDQRGLNDVDGATRQRLNDACTDSTPGPTWRRACCACGNASAWPRAPTATSR